MKKKNKKDAKIKAYQDKVAHYPVWMKPVQEPNFSDDSELDDI